MLFWSLLMSSHEHIWIWFKVIFSYNNGKFKLGQRQEKNLSTVIGLTSSMTTLNTKLVIF